MSKQIKKKPGRPRKVINIYQSKEQTNLLTKSYSQTIKNQILPLNAQNLDELNQRQQKLQRMGSFESLIQNNDLSKLEEQASDDLYALEGKKRGRGGRIIDRVSQTELTMK